MSRKRKDLTIVPGLPRICVWHGILVRPAWLVSCIRPHNGHRMYVYKPPFNQKTSSNPHQTNNNVQGFRPPSQLNLAPNDLETYNVRNDGWCLITLALVLISLTNAVPFTAESAKKFSSVPYAKAIVAATIFHHVATGIGAYQHYKLPSHYNTSMGIGVWGNIWLSLTGLFTLALLQSDAGDMSVKQAAQKVK